MRPSSSLPKGLRFRCPDSATAVTFARPGTADRAAAFDSRGRLQSSSSPAWVCIADASSGAARRVQVALERPRARPALVGERVAMSASAREGGFVYQEVLVALAILGFAMTAVFPLYVLAGRRSSTSLDLRVSTVLAEAQTETLRTRSGSMLTSAGDVVRVGSAEFVRTWLVRRSDPYPPLTTVTVTVQPRRGTALGRATSLSMRFVEAAP